MAWIETKLVIYYALFKLQAQFKCRWKDPDERCYVIQIWTKIIINYYDIILITVPVLWVRIFKTIFTRSYEVVDGKADLIENIVTYFIGKHMTICRNICILVLKIW